MNIRYLFSSPEGDIALQPEELSRPFLIAPATPHPSLLLKDYFESIRSFVLRKHAGAFISVLEECFKKKIDLSDIREISIRSEKHGVLYHLASIEIQTNGRHIKLSVSTAVSEKTAAWLRKECDILNFLNRSFSPSFLPRVYFSGEINRRARDNTQQKLFMCLSEWFEDFHEWHLSVDKADNRQKVCIWDQQHGNRYASPEEAFEIFRQASKILTLYYDTATFHHIYPWHHAAGDFVVRTVHGNIEVKLTTARNYASVLSSLHEITANPGIAIIYFLLNMSIRMRLDKLDGVGKTLWAGSFAAEAAVKGFFDALRIMEAGGRYRLGKVGDLHALLKSFDVKELETLFHPLICSYQHENPADLAVIKENLKTHVQELHRSLHTDFPDERGEGLAGL